MSNFPISAIRKSLKLPGRFLYSAFGSNPPRMWYLVPTQFDNLVNTFTHDSLLYGKQPIFNVLHSAFQDFQRLDSFLANDE